MASDTPDMGSARQITSRGERNTRRGGARIPQPSRDDERAVYQRSFRCRCHWTQHKLGSFEPNRQAI